MIVNYCTKLTNVLLVTFDSSFQIYQEGMAQGSKDTNAYDKLNRRACNAERLRDEAKVKLDQAEQEMRRMEMT